LNLIKNIRTEFKTKYKNRERLRKREREKKKDREFGGENTPSERSKASPGEEEEEEEEHDFLLLLFNPDFLKVFVNFASDYQISFFFVVSISCLIVCEEKGTEENVRPRQANRAA